MQAEVLVVGQVPANESGESGGFDEYHTTIIRQCRTRCQVLCVVVCNGRHQRSRLHPRGGELPETLRGRGGSRVGCNRWLWSWKLTDEQRSGLTSRQFVRYGLLQLDLGHDLTRIVTGRATRRAIALPDEVLTLRPELRPTD